MSRERLVVIGNGMAGRRAVEEILKRDPDRYDIAIFGAEPRVNDDRIMLSPVLDSVMEIHGKLKSTVLMVTHDVDEAALLSDRIIMMTNGPAAHIGEIQPIDLPRPRKRLEIDREPAYLNARHAVIAFLYARHAAVRDAA